MKGLEDPSLTADVAIVELHDLSKTFGSFVALRRLNLRLRPGSVTVVLGENGAGKSTLLRVLAGLITPSYGHIRVFGTSPQQQRGRIAYMSHAPMLYDELSASENLKYFASLHNGGNCPCVGSPETALRAVGLDPSLTRPVGQYSQGMRQRTSLARALQTDPELLLLDEPFSNLDVASSQHMVSLLADFRTWPIHASKAGRTIILTTHQAHLAAPLADLTLTMQNGSIISSVSGGTEE